MKSTFLVISILSFLTACKNSQAEEKKDLEKSRKTSFEVKVVKKNKVYLIDGVTFTASTFCIFGEGDVVQFCKGFTGKCIDEKNSIYSMGSFKTCKVTCEKAE